ncbi:MAG TPA: lipopolysaccharide biosynthesis protein [Patescibacteria group bacterium]|nr:lipopolysaccharide biosynthesis protein [Patescibacteria group bacterium]
MGYTIQAIKGLSWLSAVRIATRILSFARTLVVARVLSPYQFGLFGIATLVLVFVEIMTETGVNIFLVQNKKNLEDYIDTAWIVSIFRGILISAAIVVSAPFVSNFFKTPTTNLLFLIAVVPLLRGFINPCIVKFQKELMFSKEFLYRTSTFFVEVVSSITLILITKSIEGMILGMIVGVLFELFLSFIIISPRPGISFNSGIFKEVAGFGKWITASTIFNYFYQHGDDMAVGRILGAGSLGIYDMGYRISLIPLTDVADVMFRVTFPVYIKISGDLNRLRRAFFRSLIFVVLLTVPVGIILFLFPRELISLVLGAKWIGAAPVLKVLAIFGVVRAISVFSSSIFLSLEKQHIVTVISLVGLIGLGVTIIPFVLMWGISGAALSALFGTSVTLPVIFYNLYKIFYK